MALSTPPPRFARNRHLDALLDEVDGLLACVARTAPADRRAWADRRLMEAVAATLVLDGADAGQLPDLERARALTADQPPGVAAPPTVQRSDAPAGTWLDAFGTLYETPDELLRAHEVIGTAAALAADDLASDLIGHRGLDALRDLHARLTAGLVTPERAGAPRAFAQAVHDASVGRIVYLTAEADAIPGELARLGDWLAGDAARAHPVIASGILHGELLRIQPFDAANGRLARTAARLLLRAAGADPDGLSAPEPVLARDPMGYHQALADTIRRRDLTRWIERWAEALAHGLRRSIRDLGIQPDDVPDRAAGFVEDRAAFTLADYLPVVGGDRATAEADLRALLDAGRVERMLGSHGLRFAVRSEEAQADRSSGGPPAAPSSHSPTTSR